MISPYARASSRRTSIRADAPRPEPMTEFTETQAQTLIGTAEKMIEIWARLTPQKQEALLARFGTQENALAALVTTQLVAPAVD